jgi:hypothetical protein
VVGQLVDVAPLLFPVAVPALSRRTELSWREEELLAKRLMVTWIPLIVAPVGIAKPKEVALRACEVALPLKIPPRASVA